MPTFYEPNPATGVVVAIPDANPAPAVSGGNNKVVALGDSIVANALVTASGATHKSWSNYGFLAWARRYLGQRVNLPAANVLAVGGVDIASVYANQLPAALSSGANIAIVMCGHNSITITNEPLANMIAEITAIYTALIKAGIFVVAIPVRVVGTSAAYNAAQLQKFASFNSYITKFCAANSGIMLLDINPTYLDFSTGLGQSSLMLDDIHDNQLGAMTFGWLVASTLAPLTTPRDDRFMHVGDVYDATNNVTGNLLPNGLLAGSAANALNGATGSLPTTWYGERQNNSGTLTLAFSKVSDATLTNLTRSRMTIGGTADLNQALLLQEASGWAVGDTITGLCDVSWNITSGSVLGIGLRVVCEDAGYTPIDETWDGYYPGSGGSMPTGTDHPVVLRTDPLVIPANTAHVYIQGVVQSGASGAIAATVDWGRISLRKVV